MESQTIPADDQIVITPSDEKTIYVKSDVETQYGPKLALGGATYDLLSSGGENLANELEFSETHCAFDWDLETWTIDHDGVSALRDVLEAHGYRLGAIGSAIQDVLFEIMDDDVSTYADQNIWMTVEYENTHGNPGEKSGLMNAINDERGFVEFRKENGKFYRVEGNAILAPRSHYPFMGIITRIGISRL